MVGFGLGKVEVSVRGRSVSVIARGDEVSTFAGARVGDPKMKTLSTLCIAMTYQ